MPMRQLASCIDNTFNERGDCYQQSCEKEYWMHRDAKTDCEKRSATSLSLVREL
jgi:hypothetical protein